MYSVDEQLLAVLNPAGRLRYSISALRIYHGDNSYQDRSEYCGVCTLICDGSHAEITSLLMRQPHTFNREIRRQIAAIIKQHGCTSCRFDRPGNRKQRIVSK